MRRSAQPRPAPRPIARLLLAGELATAEVEGWVPAVDDEDAALETDEVDAVTVVTDLLVEAELEASAGLLILKYSEVANGSDAFVPVPEMYSCRKKVVP